MSTERERKQPAKPSGRRYKSVAEMMEKENVSQEVRSRVSELENESKVIERLIALRQSAGLTQQNFAKLTDRTQGAVSKLESSSDEELRLADVAAYSKAVNSHIVLFIGKPVHPMEWVKWHAFAMRENLSALAKMAHQNEEAEQAVQAFFGEAFFNILEILTKCHQELPSGDIQVRMRSIGCYTSVQGEPGAGLPTETKECLV